MTGMFNVQPERVLTARIYFKFDNEWTCKTGRAYVRSPETGIKIKIYLRDLTIGVFSLAALATDGIQYHCTPGSALVSSKMSRDSSGLTLARILVMGLENGTQELRHSDQPPLCCTTMIH